MSLMKNYAAAAIVSTLALTAVQVGLLTVYDMCKAADRGMVIGEIRVLEKHGGKSGDWTSAPIT